MTTEVLIVFRDATEVEPYVRAIQLCGAVAVPIAAEAGVTLGSRTGLLLTGGSDVNPALYGETSAAETDAPDGARDSIEAKLIDEALTKGAAIFGICRGMQMLNVHQGGSLVQDLENSEHHVQRTADRAQVAHDVAVEPGTLLASITGTRTIGVNSRHHQAVARLGQGLLICAKDPADGTIEAVEMPGRGFVLGVQWHPENQVLSSPNQRKLFEKFVEAAAQA